MIVLKRGAWPATPDSTPGDLYVDGAWECFTLERLPTDSEHPCIPAGLYPVEPFESPHFGRTVLRLSNVPGREAIEIHAGNTPADTQGCILVGQNRDDHALLHSRRALDALLAVVPLPTTITIEDRQE